ncbi:galanin receptor 2a-like [Lytechinus variegatus]|uniref:galanin receptor 2a-like n=1 Tax=Lytechinus variegatus TaxID=7654 RepID=UPI001BB15928|nr:galanin receptor 2a-like [Lytechinus variegatus]
MTMDDNSSAVSMNEAGHATFFPVIFIMIGVVGAIGNTLVCVVIASAITRSKSSNVNLLILHQAFIDGVTSVVLFLSYTLPVPFIPKTGGWGEFLCRMWVYESLLWMLFVVSTYNLCMMSLERFVAVAYPLTYSTKFNQRTSILMILFCWIIAPLLHYYYPVGDNYNDGGVCKSRGNRAVLAAVGIMVFFWEFFIPLVIMTVVYVRIVCLLRKQHQRVQGSSANTGNQDRQNGQLRQPFQVSPDPSGARKEGAPDSSPHHQQQRRPPAQSQKVRRNVTFTLLAVFIMYVVCWLPNHLTFLQHGFGGPLDYGGIWFNVSLVLAYLNMGINPLIYALKYKLFREGFKKLFCFFGCPSATPSDTVRTISGSDRS